MKKLCGIVIGVLMSYAINGRAAVVPQSLTQSASASTSSEKKHDYSDFYAVDLSEHIPDADKLKKLYLKNTIYDKGYEFSWNIGRTFNPTFNKIIKDYGSSDKRLKREGEDLIYAMIISAPKEIYPYVGPYLHTVPNMSQKILQMPGIKETKNKFPERISEHVKGIKNLEFLSPYMYFVLMPEIWPDYKDPVEYPKTKPIYAKVKYDKKFFEKIRQRVPPEDFYPDAPKREEDIKDKLRTINPSLSSPLTSADVKAFSRTLDEIKAFGNVSGRMAELAQAKILLNLYEDANGKGLPISTLKDLVNPCQRLVQQLRIAGLNGEFMQIVGKEGFSIEEWAYTCDKTIKAYRLSMISASTVAAILNYKNNVYKDEITKLPLILRGQQVATMLAIPEMYRAKTEDVEAVRKNRRMLAKKFKELDYNIMGAPIEFSM